MRHAMLMACLLSLARCKIVFKFKKMLKWKHPVTGKGLGAVQMLALEAQVI